MASRVELTNRIPEIMLEMPVTVAKALDIGAEAIAAEAKGRVPVNTGRLRDAIHVEKVASGGKYSTRSVVAGDSDAFYGHMVEHGTTSAPAHPFLVPAFEMLRPEVEILVRRALSQL